MTDLPAVPPTAPPRSKAGKLLALALGLAGIFAVALGCTPEKKYKVLSFFFDGVPDPLAPVAAANSQDGLTPNQFKGVIVSTHKPFAAGKCEACHGGFEGGEVGSAIQTTIDSSVCLKCHEPETRKHAMMHAPVSAGACLFCHNPHNSTQPHLLLVSAPQVCTQCHDRSLLGANPPEHLSLNSACLDCHSGHGGDKKPYFLHEVLPAHSATQPTTAPAPWTPIDLMPQNQPATQPAKESGPAPVAAHQAPAEVGVAAPAGPSLADVPAHGGSGPDESRWPYLIGSDPTPADANYPLFLDEAGADEGPVVVGRLHRPPVVGLGTIDTALEVRYRYEHDSIHNSLGTSSSGTENRIEEDLSIKTTAYVIHPNFLEFKISGDFGARQDWQGNNGSTQFSNEALYDYDIEGTFLKKEDSPVTVYSRRYEDFVDQPFGPTVDQTVQTTGAYADIKLPHDTSRIEAFHSDQTQTAVDNQESYTLSQNVFIANTSWDPSGGHRIAASYTFDNSHEDSQVEGYKPTSNSFNVNDANIAHTYTFGARQQNDLNSSLTYYDQTGEFASQRLTENESLHLKHSDTLATRYLYTFQSQSTDTISIGKFSQTQNDFSTGFTHHLYQSLVTTGDAGVDYQDRSDHSGVFGYYASLRMDYTKKVPLGKFSADLGYSFDQENNRAESVNIPVVNEAHTFNYPQPILLTGPVIASSLTVRDANGLIIYIEGADYTVRSGSDFVEINLVLGGRITNGQTVLLNYLLAAQPANVLTNNTYNADLRYDIQQGLLTGVGLHGRYLRLDQTIHSIGNFDFVPNSLNDYLLGIDYRRGSLYAGAEHEWHQSVIQPYNADRYYVRYNERGKLGWQLGFDVEYSSYDYYSLPDIVNTFQVGVNASKDLTARLSADASLSYLNEMDKSAGTTNGYQGTAEIQWTYRQTHVFAQVRESILSSRAETASYQTLWMGLRRRF